MGSGRGSQCRTQELIAQRFEVAARGEERALAATVKEADGERGRCVAHCKGRAERAKQAAEPGTGLVVADDGEQLRLSAEPAHRGAALPAAPPARSSLRSIRVS